MPRYTEAELVGAKFGRLTIVEPLEKRAGRAWVRVSCECGNTKDIRRANILTKTTPTRSCGCIQKERFAASHTTHGHSSGYNPNQYLYTLWTNILHKCDKPTNPGYRNYGGRGISVYPEWRSVDKFVSDILETLGHRTTPEHSLDRIDNDGNYEPENVRWATRVEQAANTRYSRRIGQPMETIAEYHWRLANPFISGSL
jgi:hypothetical protein